MKRKIYVVLFAIFALVAVFSAYQLISDQADYRSAVEYYQSFADAWVKPAHTAGPLENVSPEPAASADTAASAGSLPPPGPSGSLSGMAQLPGADYSAEGSASASVLSGNASYTLSAPDTDDTSGTLEQPPVSVDFDELRRMNPEIVGWIWCADTPINYPVLQGKDNEKYLHVRPDGMTSRNGSVFIDCNCAPDFSGGNTLLFGHNRKNGMFACLPDFKRQAYYDAHPVMWLLTPSGNFRVDLFAGFAVRANDWVYDTGLFSVEARNEFIDRCRQSSGFSSSVIPAPGASLLTLSTCHFHHGYTDGRYVVVGALVPCITR